ncbi:MAG: 2-oxoglutarate/2-oxoacid ferredoxin oxidoreductase subunit alpha [Moorella sp. (in: firmicutes)]|jgi:2-oxoglutarate ferredoxin oxidoreductase subunit alpha|nr:2-oxoglutarate/2-oxoacid ferredoxin oxidoreductase subunit alpha [Moorella sp. (in: firmicutes)]
MATRPVTGEQRAFMTGNEVVAWAALAAGADIMYGYPITPQNEIMHYWTRMAPKYERGFLQTEDEISAGFATVGGVLAGKRAFTATAGPGNVLMQEAMAMAEMMRLPTVVVVTQRGGPSTATVIYSQQELNLTCFGGNGEGLRIVYSPSSHDELFLYTIKAFNSAWKYRFPTFVLGDGYQSKMREPVTIFDPEARGITMEPCHPMVGLPGLPGEERDPAHLRNTYNLEDELYEVLMTAIKEYEAIAPQVVEWDTYAVDDAELLIIAHGVVSRAARAAVVSLRERGFKAGYFRPVTLKPFLAETLRPLAARARNLLVVESAYGQLKRQVQAGLYGLETPVTGYLRPGMGITPEEIVEFVHAKELI